MTVGGSAEVWSGLRGSSRRRYPQKNASRRNSAKVNNEVSTGQYATKGGGPESDEEDDSAMGNKVENRMREKAQRPGLTSQGGGCLLLQGTYRGYLTY